MRPHQRPANLFYLPRNNIYSFVQSTSPCVISTSVPGTWSGRYGCPDPSRASDGLSGVITQSVNKPLSHPTDKLTGIITQSLTAQQISKHFTETNGMSLFNRRAWGQSYTSPEAFRHQMGSETRVTSPSRYSRMARCRLSWLFPGCPIISPVAAPH